MLSVLFCRWFAIMTLLILVSSLHRPTFVLLVLSVYYRTSFSRTNYFSVTALHVHPPPTTRTITGVATMIGSQRDTVFPAIKSRTQTQNTISTDISEKMIRSRKSHLYMMNAYISMIDQFVQTSPYTTAAIACGIKASSADFVAQKRQLRKRNVSTNNDTVVRNLDDETTTAMLTTTNTIKKFKTDIPRNIAFLLYGALYQGMGQEYIYNHLYPMYFGTGTNLVTVLTKVAFDLFVQTTLLTLPVAYAIKAMIYKYTFQEAYRRYIDDILHHGLLMKYFTLWGPVQCITFSIVPERYRISFIAVVSFFWLIILSTISSRVRPSTGSTVATGSAVAIIDTNVTDAITTNIPTFVSQECELVDGLTCNIDG